MASGSRRWYDETFVRNVIDKFAQVPFYKRRRLARRITDIVESTFRLEIHHKINLNKKMVLGLYKEYERRRWYDKDPDTHKAIRCIFTLEGQKDDLRKKALIAISEAINEYIKQDKPEIEVRPKPMVQEPEPFFPDESQFAPPPVEPQFAPPPVEPKKQPSQSKVKVSGEKLFLERASESKKKKKKKIKLDDIDFKM